MSTRQTPTSSPPDLPMPLREQLRQKRRSLDPGQQKVAAQKLVEKVAALPGFGASQKLAFYLATDGELSCLPLVKHCWKLGKQCYLPVIDCSNLKLRKMEFRLFTPATALSTNRLGLQEPVDGALCPANKLDIVITPMVAFDHLNNRMGMGGGFYDQNFAFRNNSQIKPLLVGVAHQCQELERINTMEWDIPMDLIVAV